MTLPLSCNFSFILCDENVLRHRKKNNMRVRKIFWKMNVEDDNRFPTWSVLMAKSFDFNPRRIKCREKSTTNFNNGTHQMFFNSHCLPSRCQKPFSFSTIKFKLRGEEKFSACFTRLVINHRSVFCAWVSVVVGGDLKRIEFWFVRNWDFEGK